MKQVVGIIQARMGSSRLPGKVLIEVAGKPLIQHVIESARKIPSLTRVVLATSRLSQDDPLSAWAHAFGVDCYRGDEANVLDRYFQAAEQYHAEHVVRMTGDCPLLSPAIAEQVIARHLRTAADYTSNTLKRTFPRGWDVEAVTAKALSVAHTEAKDPFQWEHVTPFFWQQPERFHLECVEAEGPYRRPDLRLCVDEPADLQLVKNILEACRHKGIEASPENILGLFEHNPEWARINSAVAQKHA